jgi:hypothetical protein
MSDMSLQEQLDEDVFEGAPQHSDAAEFGAHGVQIRAHKPIQANGLPSSS